MMPEPLAIAAGVIALVRSAYTLCFCIYQTVDGIANAPKHLEAISRDLKAFYSVLGTLKGYIDDAETAPGVLHPVTSGDLEAVLTNCVTIFKGLSAVVQGYIKHSGTGDVTYWKSLRWTWKENEVRELRAHLADYKRTLNVAIAAANLINTSTTSAATQRIEEDVRELKSTLTLLLERLESDKEETQERGVILDNFRATIQRFARGADSIMTASTFQEHPPSRSPEVSFLESSLSSGCTYITAPCYRTEDPVQQFQDDNQERITTHKQQLFGLTAHTNHIRTKASNKIVRHRPLLLRSNASLHIPLAGGQLCYPPSYIRAGQATLARGEYV